MTGDLPHPCSWHSSSDRDAYVGRDNALCPKRARGAGVTCSDTRESHACLRPACSPHPPVGFVWLGFRGERLQGGWPPQTLDFFRAHAKEGSADGELTGSGGLCSTYSYCVLLGWFFR